MNLFVIKKPLYFIIVALCIVAILVTSKFIKQNSPKKFSAQEKQLLNSINGDWYSEKYNEKMSILVKNSEVILNSSTCIIETIDVNKNFIQLTYKNSSHRNFQIIDKSTILVNGVAGGNKIGASEPTKWKKYK